MMTPLHGNAFRINGRLEGESTGHRWFPSQRSRYGELCCCINLIVSINKMLNKQWRCRWFKKPRRSCNVTVNATVSQRVCLTLCGFCGHLFVYAPNQWETTLHCNVVSHWLGAYKKVILSLGYMDAISWAAVISSILFAKTNVRGLFIEKPPCKRY